MTAVSRKGASSPVKWLYSKRKYLFEGRTLDYGCGRGGDAAWLNMKGLSVSRWDPFWHPEYPYGKFDTVILTYVLNVLPPKEREAAIQRAKSYVVPGGNLICVVRRDLPLEGRPGRDCYQYYVEIPNAEIITETRQFAVYSLQT